MPLFSIVIPTYDRPDMLKRAIQSAKVQTFDDYEVIVVNDGTSCVEDVVNCEDIKSNKIKVLKTKKPGSGASVARNIAIRNADCKYLTFLDDDDELHNQLLESTRVEFLENKHCYDLVWSDVNFINYNTTDKRSEIVRYQLDTASCKYSEIVKEFMAIGIGFGVTITMNCILNIGRFNEKYKVVEDTEFFVRYISNGYLPRHIKNCPQTVHNHNSNRLTNITYDERRAIECINVLREYHRFFQANILLKIQLESHIDNLLNRCLKN